jgi:hypothetical protein
MAAKKSKAPVTTKLEYETHLASAGFTEEQLKTFTVAHGRLFIGNNTYLPRGSVVRMFGPHARAHVRSGVLSEGVDEGLVGEAQALAARLASEDEMLTPDTVAYDERNENPALLG